MTPIKKVLRPHYKGDSFNRKLGVVFVLTISKRNGVPVVPPEDIDLTGYKISCQFRFESKTGEVAISLTEQSGIVIFDTNKIRVMADTIINWNAGTYYYDIQFDDTNGDIETYIEGTINILQDVSING